MLLAAHARRLNRQAGAPAIPSLYFFTDPERTPDPVASARALPRGAAIVYRHFGAADRVRTARALAAIARRRGLTLLIAADPGLAERVGADGVHWPEARMPKQRCACRLVTAAAHSAEALSQAASMGADAATLSPVFPTASASGRAVLGLFRASQMARGAPLPVVALGGVNIANAAHLSGRGFSGIAAVSGLLA